MNLTHLHLLLNHLPVLGPVFGFGLLAFGLVRKSGELMRAAFGCFLMAAVLAAPVYLTGEPAEKAVKHLSGVAKPLIEQHEKLAGAASVATGVLGVVGLAGMIIFRRERLAPGWFGVAVLVIAAVVCGLMGWTAAVGGQIRHSEIRTASWPFLQRGDRN